jgi:hypothetical protein
MNGPQLFGGTPCPHHLIVKKVAHGVGGNTPGLLKLAFDS